MPGNAPWDQPRGSRRAETAVWLVGVLFIGGLVVAAAYVVLSMSPNLLGQAAPTSTPRALAVATPTPPASTSPSHGPSTPSPVPAATSTPLPVPEAARLFAELAEDPEINFRVEMTANARVGPESLAASMTVSQSGSDLAIDMTLQANGRSSRMQVVVKDGTAYLREGRARWIATDDLSALDLPSEPLAFSQLRPEGMEYLGTSRIGRKTLHHLRVPSVAAAGVDVAALEQFGCSTDNMALHVWVRDDGAPVSATFEHTCPDGAVAESATVALSATYKFSKVGRPINIKPPTNAIRF